MLKDYLSPDIWREYGPSETEQLTGEATASGTGEELQEPPKAADEGKEQTPPPGAPDAQVLPPAHDHDEHTPAETVQQSAAEQDLPKGETDPVTPESGPVDN